MKVFDTDSLGKKLKYYRNKNNLSQKALADKIGMKQNTISGLEIGTITTFSIAKLDKIAEILNVTLDDLLCDSINRLSINDSSRQDIYVYEAKLKKLLSNINKHQLLIFSEYLDEFFNYKNIEKEKNKD